ncbi:MAG: DUF3473 domain-containing protein [Gemmatimonadaceae bacterium]
MKPRGRSRSGHVFTVNVEDHFHDPVLGRAVDTSQWESFPSRVEHNVDLVLGLLARRHTSATLFVMDWVGERHPSLVHRIANAGHEIGLLGRPHAPADEPDEKGFRQEIRTAKALLEDLSGHEVVGYRAAVPSPPAYETWGVNALLEEGFLYDSSLSAASADPSEPGSGTPTVPHYVDGSDGILVRFPLPSTRWWAFRFPTAGGEYFRTMPFSITRAAFQECTRSGVPGIFHLRSWEVDAVPPHYGEPVMARLRHRRGCTTVLGKLELLLAEFRFTSCARVLDDSAPAATGRTTSPTAGPLPRAGR